MKAILKVNEFSFTKRLMKQTRSDDNINSHFTASIHYLILRLWEVSKQERQFSVLS
jgi:hypothetical protein